MFWTWGKVWCWSSKKSADRKARTEADSLLGLIPRERSSGGKQRLGAISKQGNVFLRTMLVEAAQSAVRYDEDFKKEYAHRCHSKPTGVAKVAAARKLAVRLYWMLRNQAPYSKAVHNEGSPSHSLVG
jgi:transposase